MTSVSIPVDIKEDLAKVKKILKKNKLYKRNQEIF